MPRGPPHCRPPIRWGRSYVGGIDLDPRRAAEALGRCGAEAAEQCILRHDARVEEDRVDGHGVAVGESDATEAPVGVGADGGDGPPFDRDAACDQRCSIGISQFSGVGEEDDLWRPLAKQLRLVGAPRTRREHRDAPVANLPAVAVGADDGARAPLLGEARDLGELIAQPGRDEQAAGAVALAGAELYREAGLDSLGGHHLAGGHDDAVRSTSARPVATRSSGDQPSRPSTPCM